ncbi:uncharacterized protein BT62DRAFT_1077480 [Guyanagaster necrorhizus]|uniref:Uncharacterized protein n=1 Tax=Guyanagaster necrorhizus TaxID=856835 RepID=A0A9P7VQF7_9AGAR|nr:uncharacterized protein BT62DRAFT_1077480 [Guyanagaster necrorhizus MCA 3950]KAG7444702.1 hypothetical protein BT62DRAFT_1077480 [Guyanagaster necrorhizus MCA 3950]
MIRFHDTRFFRSAASDISSDLGTRIVVTGPSTEDFSPSFQIHTSPPPDVHLAPVMPPIDASSYSSVENSDITSLTVANASSTSQIQELPEIPSAPLFSDGELSSGLLPLTDHSSANYNASLSFFEPRKSQSGKKGKGRKDTKYQNKIVQTYTPPAGPYIEDPQKETALFRPPVKEPSV